MTDTTTEAVEAAWEEYEASAKPCGNDGDMEFFSVDSMTEEAYNIYTIAKAIAAERDALRSQNIELQSALAETEAQAQTARDDATPLSEATCVMQKRIGSTPFPEGLQAIADDAHVLIARQAFRITQLEKVAMRPTP